MSGVIPAVLNIGSGKDWKEDALNLDIEPEWGPDVLYDLNQPLPPYGIEFATARFGQIRLKEDHFDLIQAFDVLEHIPQLPTAMSTCLAWLRVGGVFRINVPYDLSWGAWQDPTHVRAFNERSWLYYTDWFWYLGWNHWRFDLVSLQYMLSPIGKELHAQGTSTDNLVRVPRAVDSMLVELCKRRLTTEELGILEARRRGARTPVLA
jgi:SAM-dependent methyltransferase